MKSIKNIPSDKVISIDIETVRYKNTYDELPEEWKDAWCYKSKQDGVVPPLEVLSSTYQNNTSLYAEFSRVVVVSMTFLKGGKPHCKQYASEDEALLLSTLAKDLAVFKEKGYYLVGHAAKFFDYPYLCKRYIVHQIPIPEILDESDMKPWDMKLLCTNEMWRSFGQGAGSSLQAICTVLKVPVSKVDMVGDEVGKAFFDGKLLDIAAYCNKDTVACFNIFRRFKYEPIFQFDEVVYVNPNEVLQRVDIFTDIMKNGITELVKQSLMELIKTESVDKLIDLVRGAMIERKITSEDEAFFVVLKEMSKLYV